MDHFKEQLVTVRNLTEYRLAKGAMIVFLTVAFFLMAIGGFIPALVAAAASGALFYFKRFLYVEYEYIITNGEIDIDAVYEVKTRKRKISFNIKEVSLLAPIDSYEFKDAANKPEKIINAVPRGNTDKVYVALLTEGNERAQVHFVPNGDFINTCFLFNPKAVKKAL